MLERYEREVNQGHRSAIKRILEGDAPPSMLLTLCISAIRSKCKSRAQVCSSMISESNYGEGAKVELTDGWYGTDPIGFSLHIFDSLALILDVIGIPLMLFWMGHCQSNFLWENCLWDRNFG